MGSGYTSGVIRSMKAWPSSASPATLTALGSAEVVLATLELDRAAIVDTYGSTAAEFKRDGAVLGNRGQVLGTVAPFAFSDMRALALYILFLDPGFLADSEEGDDEDVGGVTDPH